MFFEKCVVEVFWLVFEMSPSILGGQIDLFWFFLGIFQRGVHFCPFRFEREGRPLGWVMPFPLVYRASRVGTLFYSYMWIYYTCCKIFCRLNNTFHIAIYVDILPFNRPVAFRRKTPERSWWIATRPSSASSIGCHCLGAARAATKQLVLWLGASAGGNTNKTLLGWGMVVSVGWTSAVQAKSICSDKYLGWTFESKCYKHCSQLNH